MASQASARRVATAALRHTEMGAHERKYQSCEVRIYSFHGCKGAPPSIACAWERREDDGRSGHGHHRYDLKFYDKLPRLFPNYPAMRDMFVNNPQLIQETALRNSTLQGAYMILAARALGLDCGPMSGFDNAKLDEEFFAAGKCESCEQEFFPEGHVKSNFLCNIGYGDPATLMPRGPRLDFNEACTLL